MTTLQLAILIILTGVSLLILGIFFILLLLNFKTGEGMKEQVDDTHNRLYRVEYIIQQLMQNIQMNQMENSFTDIIKDGAGQDSKPDIKQALASGNVIFRSIDGKHVANSLEELMEKMSSDPDSGITFKDAALLRKFFEQITQDSEPLDDEDDDTLRS